MGYDRSPDYGTPEPPRWVWLLVALATIGILLFGLALSGTSNS